MEITRSGATRSAMRHVPVLVAGFDVLAGDQGQQPDRVGLFGGQLDTRRAASMIARASLTSPLINAALASGSSHAHTGLPEAS